MTVGRTIDINITVVLDFDVLVTDRGHREPIGDADRFVDHNRHFLFVLLLVFPVSRTRVLVDVVELRVVVQSVIGVSVIIVRVMNRLKWSYSWGLRRGVSMWDCFRLRRGSF